MDEAKVREMAANVNDLLVMHRRHNESIVRLLKVCLEQLQFKPNQHTEQQCIEAGRRRKDLIAALEFVIKEREQL